MYGLPINRDLPAASLAVHEYPKVWLYRWLADGSWLEEPRTVYDDTWHAHCIYVTAELMHRRCDSRIVMAMAAAHQLSALGPRSPGPAVPPAKELCLVAARPDPALRDPGARGLRRGERDGAAAGVARL